MKATTFMHEPIENARLSMIPMNQNKWVTVHDVTVGLSEALGVMQRTSPSVWMLAKRNLAIIETAILHSIWRVSLHPTTYHGARLSPVDQRTAIQLSAYFDHFVFELFTSRAFKLTTEELATIETLTLTPRYRLCISWSP